MMDIVGAFLGGKEAEGAGFQGRNWLNEFLHVALNPRQDVGEGDRNEDIFKSLGVGHFPAFDVIAAGFQIPVQGLNEHAVLIAGNDFGRFFSVGHECDRFLTVFPPEEKQVAAKLMFLGKQDIREEVGGARLTGSEKGANRGRGNIRA